MEQEKVTKPNYSLYLKVFWGLFSFLILSISAVFLLINMGAFGKLPTFEELENPERNFATEIISSDGITLGKYYRENRTPVKFQDLPENLVKALVATEDERFFEHSGIDFFALARAVSKLGQDGGGSTITQQLAKQLFTENYGTKNIIERVFQKLKEWVIAVKLERQYTKNEIITMYLNKYDFLYNAIGIRSASRIYYNKEPKDLAIEESAILVGMAKNPSLYNPRRFPVNAQKRRSTVFGQMERNGLITKAEKDSLNKLPLEIEFTPEGHSDGHATYFREHLRDYLKGWIRNNPKEDGTYYDLYRDGLKIYVTLDSRMQKYAEQAVSEHMSNLQRIFFKEQKRNRTAPFYDLKNSEIDKILFKAIRTTQRYQTLNNQGVSKKEILRNFKKPRKMKVFDWKKGEKDTVMSPYDSIKYYKSFLRSGLMAIEPQTGHIKAWVGGINHKYFKYDHVKQGKRQVGSTFKPFVYASAINQFRISPCEKYPNTPYTIPKGKYGLLSDWTPKNAGEEYGGELTLKQALAKSVNVITARMIDRVGPETVVNLAKKSGITSHIDPYPSIALGTLDASLYDMVGAYAMFANKGFRVHQTMVMRIEDKNGSILQRFVPASEEVMSEEAAYAVLDLLKGVTMEGSGVRLRGKWGKYPENVATGYPYQFTNPIAGKTGTTQNQSDGWFMGVVPNLAVGVWTGGEERATHFAGITYGQGASMSLPTWALFMKKCYADEALSISQEDFEQPENFGIAIDCNSSGEDEDASSTIETSTDF
ncbi:transglycosylase domain-containing protein [Wenyingzhuangia sp. 2_MG-2023]|uniref:transglycosylase domain-containing protein n=1 Tax=Wenyingzhuangia sp. 2_MG-2023 TaxID=3062639 RepID=UPI0026E1464C|nr:transglycosylase domain-containing protein [Wenyingzhuangia sp. 2_MG-2023]MDO6736723.1 transglycosylase domain-containing protein [Wenyingzhuangia sp. 2_MG-2023]MDO6800983.1 transglycosylase domain-containing protein [Wenyingzhuangia sp. 1_MG-2023]